MSPDRCASLAGVSFPAPPSPSLGLAEATCHTAMSSCPASLLPAPMTNSVPSCQERVPSETGSDGCPSPRRVPGHSRSRCPVPRSLASLGSPRPGSPLQTSCPGPVHAGPGTSSGNKPGTGSRPPPRGELRSRPGRGVPSSRPTARAAPRHAPGRRRGSTGGPYPGAGSSRQGRAELTFVLQVDQYQQEGEHRAQSAGHRAGGHHVREHAGEKQGCGTHQPRLALTMQQHPPVVGLLSGLSSSWRPVEGGSGGRGPDDSTPQLPQPSNRILPGR